MKKLLILATLLLVLVVAVVACTETPVGPGEETTIEVTQEPATDAPTEAPTEEPTEAPTNEQPTEAPTDEQPTEAPTDEQPTEAPTDEQPTEAPTEPPVDPAAPLHTVEPDFLANYANQAGNMTCNNHLGSAEVKTEDGRTFIRLTTGGSDPYLAFIDGQKNLKVGRYMAVSYRTNSTTDGQFFMGSGNGWTGQGDCFNQAWNEDGNWNLAIIDLENVGLTALTDLVLNYARIDFFVNEGAAGDYFDIEYIAFFNTAEYAAAYDFEMHKAPMWNESGVITHQSFDQLYTGTGAAENGPENLFTPGQSASWDYVADLSETGAEFLTYWGWIGFKGELGQFGYQINGGSAVYNADWTHATEQPVIDAAMNGGADGGSRFKISINLAGLEGENSVRTLYKTADGVEVCLGEFIVKLPTKPTHYDNYNVPADQWTITGHRPTLQDSTDGMVAAGGVEYGALLHQGSIYLGEVDLSKYSKVVIYWGCDNSQVTIDHYNNNAQNRIMLLNAVMENVMSPAEETILAYTGYELMGWAVTAIEIDLTGVDYNGPVYVAIDTLPGTFALFSSVEFIGGEISAHEHAYETAVTAPTCTEAGYTTYTCACGDSYVADETAALGHSFADGVCGVCGEKDPNYVAPEYYDNYNVPQDQWTVSGHCPQIVGKDGHANSPMVAAGGVESGALLHQGAIALGDVDLSKYSKVIIYYGVDNSEVTWGHWNASANNRIMLTSADTHLQNSPAAEVIIAGATYEPCGWAVVAFEIDLTGVDYNGPVFVTYDTLPGTFMLFSSVEFIGGEKTAEPEVPAGPVVIGMNDPASKVVTASNDEMRFLDGNMAQVGQAFTPGKYTEFNGVVNFSKSGNVAFIMDWGWVGINTDTFQFGYIINGGDPIMSDDYAFATDDAVKAAAAAQGASNASRFNGGVAAFFLPVGEHNVKFVVQQDGAEYVIIREYTIVVTE